MSPPSFYAFNFNLRHYDTDLIDMYAGKMDQLLEKFSPAKVDEILDLPPGSTVRQGLTLVHFAAQLEPCLTQDNTLHTLNTPSHPLNMGYTTPTRTPYPIQSAQVELKSGRV